MNIKNISRYKNFLILAVFVVVIIVFGLSINSPTPVSALTQLACTRYENDTDIPIYTCGTSTYYDTACGCPTGSSSSTTQTITVTTSPITNITTTSATGGGTVTIN